MVLAGDALLSSLSRNEHVGPDLYPQVKGKPSLGDVIKLTNQAVPPPKNSAGFLPSSWALPCGLDPFPQGWSSSDLHLISHCLLKCFHNTLFLPSFGDLPELKSFCSLTSNFVLYGIFPGGLIGVLREATRPCGGRNWCRQRSW